MANIEKRSRIHPERLSGEFYLTSLLQEALEQQEMCAAELEGIQVQALQLLAATIERYNRGESSSVQVEVAQAIMESNFYIIGLYLKTLPDAASALAAVKTEPLEKLHRKGCRVMQAKLNTARHLYLLVRQTKIQTANESYNATLGGIQSFFDLYNPDFEAHESPADIDYQLANPVIDLAGVEFMIQYLKRLYLENLFCAYFDPAALHEIMLGYDAGYKDLLINLFAQALQNALGCLLLKKDVFSLRIEPADMGKLRHMLGGQTKAGVYELLRRETDKLITALPTQNGELTQYIRSTLPELAARLRSTVRQNALQTFFPPRRAEAIKTIQYSMGKKMEDEKYRAVLSELLSCTHQGDRIRIIKEHIRSLADMEDLLLDGELSEFETFTVLDLLADIEITVLINRHSGLDTADLPEAEANFRLHLENYLRAMRPKKLKKLQETALNIETE